MRLFGIKPKNQQQKPTHTPFERRINMHEYNEWCRQFNVSSRVQRY